MLNVILGLVHQRVLLLIYVKQSNVVRQRCWVQIIVHACVKILSEDRRDKFELLYAIEDANEFLVRRHGWSPLEVLPNGKMVALIVEELL